MGKMTDALRKAKLLKEQKEGGRGAPEADRRTPVSLQGSGAAAEEIAIAPEQGVPGKGPVVHLPEPAEQPPGSASVEMEEEPRPETPAPEDFAFPSETVFRTPEIHGTPVVLPKVEPEVEPAVVQAPRREKALPEVEPTPLEAARPYLSVHYVKDDRTAEEFRGLKNQLLAEGPTVRVIMVSSDGPGEGKSTLAGNLAVSLTNTYGERVVLVDGNVLRPKLSEVLGLTERGLDQVIRGHISPEGATVKTDIPGLWAVPAGADIARTEGLLDSTAVLDLLKWLRGRFTRVVMELPPVGEAPETLAILPKADVVLIPVLRSRTRRKRLRRLLKRLGDHCTGKLRCVFIDA
jgi:Mrp family chromosome partitioning ATPase